MSEPVWNKFLTERDKQVFAAAGYGARAGFGTRPALLVIDVSYAFCGDRPEPILESIKRWRNSCGAESWVAIGHIKRLQRVLDNDADYVTPHDMLAELRDDNKQLIAYMRVTHALCDEHGDVASGSLLENWIDEAERRIWFLFEAGRTHGASA